MRLRVHDNLSVQCELPTNKEYQFQAVIYEKNQIQEKLNLQIMELQTKNNEIKKREMSVLEGD